MDFEATEEHRLIRDAIRKLCSDFPDDYWSKCDTEHRFP